VLPYSCICYPTYQSSSGDGGQQLLVFEALPLLLLLSYALPVPASPFRGALLPQRD